MLFNLHALKKLRVWGSRTGLALTFKGRAKERELGALAPADGAEAVWCGGGK